MEYIINIGSSLKVFMVWQNIEAKLDAQKRNNSKYRLKFHNVGLVIKREFDQIF